MRDKTETEYAGEVPTRNSVGSLGPDGRKLSTSERLRLGYLTGQEDDPNLAPKPEFFHGQDRDYPELPDSTLPWQDR